MLTPSEVTTAHLYAILALTVLAVAIAQIGDIVSRRIGGWSKS